MVLLSSGQADRLAPHHKLSSREKKERKSARLLYFTRRRYRINGDASLPRPVFQESLNPSLPRPVCRVLHHGHVGGFPPLSPPPLPLLEPPLHLAMSVGGRGALMSPFVRPQ